MTVMPCPQCGGYIEDNLFGTQCKKCGYKVGQAISVLGYQTRVMCDCSAELTALRAQISALQTEKSNLRKRAEELVSALADSEVKAKHWRDQHANEVRRAKILKDTTDLPLERVRAYELMGELQGHVAKLQEEKEDMRQHCIRCIDEPDGALCSAVTMLEATESERDQLRAEVERLKNELVMRDGYIICHEEGQKQDALTINYMRGRLESLEVAEFISYEKGAESMRERVKAVVEKVGNNRCACVDRERCASCGTVDDILADVSALPLK